MRLSRVFEAPRSLVYQAFTDPDQLTKWFGPVGYSAPRDEMVFDVRAGGRDHVVMVNDADPTERIELDSLYTEVIPGSLIVGTDAGPDGGNFRFEFFDEPNGKTRLELRVWPVTQSWIDEASVGWESSFTKLDQLVHSGV
jgi:uncharacterized protein YndB with AHSA1/START domain